MRAGGRPRSDVLNPGGSFEAGGSRAQDWQLAVISAGRVEVARGSIAASEPARGGGQGWAVSGIATVDGHARTDPPPSG